MSHNDLWEQVKSEGQNEDNERFEKITPDRYHMGRNQVEDGTYKDNRRDDSSNTSDSSRGASSSSR